VPPSQPGCVRQPKRALSERADRITWLAAHSALVPGDAARAAATLIAYQPPWHARFTFRCTFAAEHYQYVASIGPLALVAAGLTVGLG
jgi:hypothetical protein